MATTTKKSSPKSKSKTVKAKTSTTKKTSAAKTANKSQSTETVTVISTKTKRKDSSKRVIDLQTLRNMNLIAALLFALLAVAAGFVMNNASHQITVGHLTQDALVNVEQTAFAPAVRVIYDVEIRWLVVATMLLAVVLPFLNTGRLESAYQKYAKNTRMMPFRWVDIGVTGALMTGTVALLSGVTDLFVLKLIGWTVITSALLGLIAERQNNQATRRVRSAYATGVLVGALPLLLIGGYTVSTIVHGAIRSPWYVYAAFATLVVGYVLVALSQHKQFARVGVWANSLQVERNYVAVSVVTKAVFAIVLIVGLRTA